MRQMIEQKLRLGTKSFKTHVDKISSGSVSKDPIEPAKKHLYTRSETEMRISSY